MRVFLSLALALFKLLGDPFGGPQVAAQATIGPLGRFVNVATALEVDCLEAKVGQVTRLNAIVISYLVNSRDWPHFVCFFSLPAPPAPPPPSVSLSPSPACNLRRLFLLTLRSSFYFLSLAKVATGTATAATSESV